MTISISQRVLLEVRAPIPFYFTSSTDIFLFRYPSSTHPQSSQCSHSRHRNIPHARRPPTNPRPLFRSPSLKLARTFPPTWLRPSTKDPRHLRHGRHRTRSRSARPCLRHDDPILQSLTPISRARKGGKVREL